ncbi:hypothetical protein SKZ59_16180 [Janthinobacterium sp. GMG2]|uniref:hypothetical protein n=1 Tax=Janthinobacterium sp. GMG2 TaxID=3096606 RepID=UPI0029F52E91|nr:hypothetical protein [Janthinobacterium sp. GMG2]MDX8123321.1 hypothetical protein [Janthinobacterium sp. GMG2]
MRLNFVETLRQERNSLPNPTGYGFDRDVWHQAYLAQRDGSPTDHHVYLLGLVLAHQTERVHGSVDHLASNLHFRTLDELPQFFSTRINEVQLRVFNSFKKALEGVEVISRERMNEMRCFTDAAGNSHSLQVPLEAIVDAIGSALKLLGRTGGLGKLETEQQEGIALDDALNRLMALAQHSLSIQRVWNSVVWWGAAVAVAPDGQSYFVDESGRDLVTRGTVDLARRPALMARAIESFRGANPDIPDNNVLVPYVQLYDGRLTVRALPAFLVPEDERKLLLEARRSHGILQDATLGNFVQEIHPQVGLHISEIMVIWGELATIAGQLHALAQPLDMVKDKSNLSTIVVSRFPRDEIIGAIKGCVVLSSDKVKQCIDFLCFTPSKGATLWDKPLLSAGDDVMLLWWPLQGAHHARLLGAWAKSHKKLAIAFDSKGPTNEAILAEAIRSAIRKSSYQSHMRFVGAALHPRHKSDEDIDLLIVIDDTAFVIETASIPSPAEAYEFYETEIRLDKKAGQCRKQCAALKHDLNQISEWASDDGLRGKVTRVFGLVITNSYLRDGMYSDDICYCHWDTLINVISGGMYFGLTHGIEEFTLKAPIQIGPHGSVADGVIAALRKSPKAEFFSRCVVPVEYRVKGFDDTDVEGYYRALEMDFPPQEMLEKRLRECSFAATLEEVDNPEFD